MEDKNIYLCNDINYTKLNPYSLTSLVINNIQYPSVMLYIYSELLCFTKEKSKIFNSANKSLSPKELNKKFNILFEQCNNKLLRDALTLAYKMKISQENDCKKDLLTFNKNAINNSNLNPALKEIIIEIILNIKNEVENNIYLQNIDDNEINNNNKIFEIYKVYYALSNLLDDGYDIKEFIEKNQEQIKKMTFESDNENLSPLFFKKKKLFQQYYNNINPELMTDIVNRYRILPDNFKYIKDELNNSKNLAQLLRKKKIVPTHLGIKKKKDFNTILKNKVKQLLVNNIQETLYDTTHTIDNELIDQIYEYYKQDKLDLDDHFVKFIKELEKQYIDEDEIEYLRFFKPSSPENIEPEEISIKEEPSDLNISTEDTELFFNPIFKELNDSDNEVEETVNQPTHFCLSPYNIKLFTINNKYYSSIIHYIILVKISWYSNLGIDYCYKLLFKNSKKVYLKSKKVLNMKYIKNVKNFKSISTLKSKMHEILENRKIILAKDANYHKFAGKNSNISLQNMLISTEPRNLIYNSNDIILGNGPLNNGMNILGKNMENLRSLLIKNQDKINRKKKKIIKHIYTCGSDQFLNKWFVLRLTDIIRTVIIFAKYFNIDRINSEIIDYIIKNIYLPCKNIYLKQVSTKKYPQSFEKLSSKIFHKYSLKFDYKGKLDNNSILTLWIILSCLCSHIIKYIKNDGEDYINRVSTDLTNKYNKSYLTILKAIKFLEKIFTSYDEKEVYDYLPSIASIISGKKFNIKKINQNNVKNIMTNYHLIKNYAEAIEWVYSTNNINRINFFIPN